MISTIEFESLEKSTTFSYAKDLDFFKKSKHISFKPGLNIIFGQNGCGKSTILRMAALIMAAEQGGVSTITQSWINEISRCQSNTDSSPLKGIHMLHDGQPILYGNPRNAVGLIGGGAGFDDDFFTEGVANTMSKKSTGYTTMQRLGLMLEIAMKKKPFPASVENRVKFNSSISDRQGCIDAALKMQIGEMPLGQQTLIFDEPESGLAVVAQRNLFSMLAKSAIDNNFQIIIATHSVFSLALNENEVNYIDMIPGYINQAKAAVKLLSAQIN
jgi:predicted ATPase